jgi:phosphomannomutase
MERPHTSIAEVSLVSSLSYAPRELGFGTSGRRGRVRDLTQMEIYICALGELQYLQSLDLANGGIVKGDDFFYACDLRPSSSRFAPEEQNRGEIAQAIERALRDAGMRPVNCGPIPTPALAFHALTRGKGSMMITGSHIPFDRNGYKTNTSCGELLKEHEAPIAEHVRRVRERVYNQPANESPFNEQGMFKSGHAELGPEDPSAREGYIRRYVDFFSSDSLACMRIRCYQHSAVGRDLLVELLRALGADVTPSGRSDAFVPIDTENIDAERLAVIQALADKAIAEDGPIFAVVSTDGDSDRPLLLGFEEDGNTVKFFGGDQLGMIAAEFLGADAVVVPVSCNDGIDRGPLAAMLEPRTRIGSPYVIAGMAAALAKGKHSVCGWEANGGFLTGSDFVRKGRVLTALPTRDALLPLLAALFSAKEKGISLADLFAVLPGRHSRAGLLKEFPRATALRIISAFCCDHPHIREVDFDAAGHRIALDDQRNPVELTPELASALNDIRARCAVFFDCFGPVSRINYVDGVRITFAGGEVAHLRPSGNADEFRIYAAADTLARCEEIVRLGIAEPDGILRRLERHVAAEQGAVARVSC